MEAGGGDMSFLTALSELVDNAIESIFELREESERTIDIVVDHKGAGKLSIKDKGAGMGGDLGKVKRLGGSRERENLEVSMAEHWPPFITARLGRYGVGAKVAT